MEVAERSASQAPAQPYAARERVSGNGWSVDLWTLLEPGFPYGEDLLQFIWESQLFDRGGLQTTDGRSIEVLNPGRVQRNSGPDLCEALIRIDDQLWAGNVEVHLRSSEWNAHGHQGDPAYDNVVLHVVYQHDRDVRTTKGVLPPTLELMSRVPLGSVAIHRDLMLNQSWVPCAGSVHHVDPRLIEGWLGRVLLERLDRKAAEVEAMFHQLGNDPRETFYHLLLRGFGLNVNADPFGMLAVALPLRILEKYRDDPFRTEALLFGQAGLLRTDFVDDHPRRLQEEHRLLAQLHGLRPAPLSAWKFGRIRPANFPTIRIAQLAQLIARSDGAFGSLLDQDDPLALCATLDVEAGGYWHDHYQFDRIAMPSIKRLGRSAAEGIIINTIVPYLFAMKRLRGDTALAERALRFLGALPAERNSISKAWERIGVQAGCAAHSQALLELKNAYCGQRRCLSCVIGAALLKHPIP
ncbi:MAG: DUF2851 family protein [Flavobacteriales bacterium]